MLNTVYLTNNAKNVKTSGCVMLLGGFDGMHVGHRTLLAKAKGYGLPVGAMTIVGGKKTQSLFTLEEREHMFKDLGLDFAVCFSFEEIKELSPSEFLRMLSEEFAPKAFVCGDDFRFGKNAAGDTETLKAGTQVCVEVENLLKIDGEKVSASTVKSFLSTGNVERANTLLGEPFFLIGKVEEDRKIGRTIGFPTANIRYPTGKFPLAQGVYETRAEVDGVTYKGITNYGARPTYGDESVWTETHLHGFSGDLYGKTLKVEFIRFLREIRRFENGAALAEQLREDIRRITTND